MLLKMLLAPAAAACTVLLVSLGGGGEGQAAGLVPQCHCVDGGGRWSPANRCPPLTGVACGSGLSGAAKVDDNLVCSSSGAPAPCPITGSVTVTYDSCTSVACVQEEHMNCNAGCPSPTGWSQVADAATVYPTQDACCNGGSTCSYNFEVNLLSSGTCSNQTTVHCAWSHQYQCHT
jgi:hypothetical protein